ncbi:ubinuclein-1-like isoform X3 [Hibiscus syriacus]|uniref:ubinuclein-1-like isoform X3 n=1 Tax=Hibiscus syriacus TaxID=106335 RepID=UPI001922C335|nr:ubinuclein-1-like isoform X3 [Hibiscus syriacus]
MAEVRGDKVDDLVLSKHVKVEQGRLNCAATNAVLEEQSSALLQISAATGEPEVSNKDASITPSNSKDSDKYRSISIHSSDLGNNTNSLATYQKHLEKRFCKKHKSPVRKLMTENNEEGISTEVEKRKKRATCGELPDLNLPVYPVQSELKDVSNLRPKGTMLEKAMRELEKVVAESRLSTMEVQDIDASSAAIERRLPCEVKQKLAKVARLAHSSQGKISKELINMLMNILGHSMQLRTLKRNLKEMILMELSAKQENADRFQQIKLEVTEMIKLQVSKLGDVATGSRQEVLGSEEKVVLKQKHCMDNIMEDKICDLYDLYIQGMDEDKGPQIRKLYVELAELWPNGIMDKHGIKSAICRAKERKRALCENDKVREIRRKKSAQKMEGSVEGEACSVSELQAVQENQESASSSHILALPCRTTSCKETLDQHLAAPREITSVQPNSGLDISEEKIEKMATPSLKEQMKQKEKSKNREKKLSTKQEKESRKSNKKVIGQPDAAS